MLAARDGRVEVLPLLQEAVVQVCYVLLHVAPDHDPLNGRVLGDAAAVQDEALHGINKCRTPPCTGAASMQDEALH